MNKLWNDYKRKLKHIMIDFAKINREVANHWYTRTFQQTYDDLVLGCKELLRFLTKN